ncbi:serine hydrolase [Mesorhizobium sp. M0522]|uniref:serine hydrolase domain-containing protein n=1 Tax=Mesorhizobium sp. M0522 TaxID=2956958 RepID=UPI003336194A
MAALVCAGKVTSAKSMRLAREAPDEVNPRVNVVIEFYEDAALVASALTGLFWRAIPSQESRSYRSRSSSRQKKPAIQRLPPAPTASFFVAHGPPGSLPSARRRHRNLRVKPFKRAQRALVDQSQKQPQLGKARHMTLPSIANPDLAIVFDNKPRWNLPDYRRRGFHNLHTTVRYAMSLRAPRVQPLRKDVDWTIGERPGVARYLAMPHFSAFVVVRGERILYEAYAPDFGPERPHSIQSITKTTLNLMLGRAVADGLVNLDDQIRKYLPEIGTGYAEATVKAVADMNVANDFIEDYSDPYAPIYDWEPAFGWRLPLDGQKEGTTRSFICGITGGDLANRTGEALYKSTNTDVLGWIVERVSGRPLRDWLIEIVEAAGLEGCFHISCDREGVPLVCGGTCLTARDLARYGLLFARKGEGVDGRRVGDAAFIEETRRNPGPVYPKPRDWMRYSRQTFTDGTWLGHGGYGGQFMLANPDTGTVVVYFSVLENSSAMDPNFSGPLVKMMAELAAET